MFPSCEIVNEIQGHVELELKSHPDWYYLAVLQSETVFYVC